MKRKSLELVFILPLMLLSIFAFETLPVSPLSGGDPENMPRFPGCEDIATVDGRKACSFEKLVVFMQKNINYPEAAKKSKTEGKVIVTFTVEKDGTIKNAMVKNGIGSGCDEEALRVINAMPNWVPGTKDGKAVAVEMALPIMFKDSQKGEE
ncbi:MAG: energy transducer TonB [Saprospiraceae bacterium]